MTHAINHYFSDFSDSHGACLQSLAFAVPSDWCKSCMHLALMRADRSIEKFWIEATIVQPQPLHLSIACLGAQGAAQAVEDAAVLGELSRHPFINTRVNFGIVPTTYTSSFENPARVRMVNASTAQRIHPLHARWTSTK